MLTHFRAPVMAASLMLFSAGAIASGTTIELANNGGFESGDFSGWTQFENGGVQSISTANPSSGTYSANLVANGLPINSLIKNANIGIGLVNPGDEVTISFDMRGTTAIGGLVFAEFFSEVDGGGTSSAEILGGGPLFAAADPQEWTTYMFTTFAGSDVSGGITLQLGAVCGANNDCVSDVYFDNISVSIAAAVPVPAAVWLFGSALGLLGFGKRRKA